MEHTLQQFTDEIAERKAAAVMLPAAPSIAKGPNPEVLGRILVRVAEWREEQEAKKREAAANALKT